MNILVHLVNIHKSFLKNCEWESGSQARALAPIWSRTACKNAALASFIWWFGSCGPSITKNCAPPILQTQPLFPWEGFSVDAGELLWGSDCIQPWVHWWSQVLVFDWLWKPTHTNSTGRETLPPFHRPMLESSVVRIIHLLKAPTATPGLVLSLQTETVRTYVEHIELFSACSFQAQFESLSHCTAKNAPVCRYLIGPLMCLPSLKQKNVHLFLRRTCDSRDYVWGCQIRKISDCICVLTLPDRQKYAFMDGEQAHCSAYFTRIYIMWSF